MNYHNMIKTENTASRYDAWAEYRGELTAYIKGCLQENCDSDSWVAIWGAGGCNDIEIAELAKDYRLLLIDQDVDMLEQLRDRLGLSLERCKVADVGFWSITHEDYKMFEALLLDGVSYEELESYFNDLLKNIPEPISLEGYEVDASVVVGLASQLNSRFAALLHLHRDMVSHMDMEKVLAIVKALNDTATQRLYVSLRQLTKRLVITGYETKSCHSKEEVELAQEDLRKILDLGLDGGRYLSGREGEHIFVAGNEFWHRIIYKTIIMDKLEDLGRCQLFCWPFAEEKYYSMLMVALAING